MKITRVFSQGLSLCLIVSLSGVPSLAIAADSGLDRVLKSNVSSGDAATAKPDVGAICEALVNANTGNFVTSDNQPVMTIDADCAARYTYRTDQVKNCAVTMNSAIAKAGGVKNVDAVCNGTGGKIPPSVQTYCALRAVAENSQAIQYCNAYVSADKAQKSMGKTLYFDIAAAGACWADYAAITLAQKNGLNYEGVACGGAAMAASLFELWQTAAVLKRKKNAFDDDKAGGHSAGSYKIDSSNNVKERGNLAKALEITASSAGSAAAFAMGVCYYNKDKNAGLCKQFGSIANDPNKIGKTKAEAYGAKFVEKTDAQGSIVDDHGCTIDKPCPQYEVVRDKRRDERFKPEKVQRQQAQANIAMQSALIFTALAGMRGVAQASAATTTKRVGDILQSMFDPSNPNTTISTSGIMTSSLPNLFAATSSSFTNPDGSKKSAVTAATDSAFLAPPGGQLNGKAGEIASKIGTWGDPSSSAGLGNAVASAAMAAGVTNGSLLSKIKGETASLFANLPKEDGGYGGGGGGRPLAGHSGSGGAGDLNLKSLLGGESEDQDVAGGSTLAYRTPASDEDIWHSKNPNGNNLFQIVSDKYDTVQRKSGVGSGL